MNKTMHNWEIVGLNPELGLMEERQQSQIGNFKKKSCVSEKRCRSLKTVKNHRIIF